MSYSDVPIWEKYTLTIEEAAKYFRIGEKKLRKLVEENSDANWLIMNGNRVQIKRRQFEKVIDSLDVIYSSRIKARSSFGKEFYQWRKNDVITKAAF